MNNYQFITLLIAIWGALTGSIALFLRIQNFLRDKARLKITPKFQFSYLGNEYPPDITLKVKVANYGRRPVSIDKIIGEFTDGDKHWLKYNLSLGIAEGKAVISIIGSKRLPDGKSFGELKRLIVVDQTGKEWKSNKDFGQDRIKDILAAEKINAERISNEKEYVDIKLFEAGSRYFISTKITRGSHSKYKRKEVYSHSEAEKVYEEHIDRAQKLINGQSEEF